MSLRNLWNKDIRIKASNNKETREFTIFYPAQKGKIVPIGQKLLLNILSYSDIIVHIDTGLSFNKEATTWDYSAAVRNTLSALAVHFEYRTYKAASSRGVLGGIVNLNNKKTTHEVMTFQLCKGFNYTDLLHAIAQIGGFIYVLPEHSEKQKYILKVFNEKIEEDHEKLALFEYILFINDFMGQTVIRTKHLDLKTVKEIFNIND
ncbi:hypothetical protein [Petroclostridium sp. X23]|uniref:hypothetical protein n=1 Tax=Petroclostridium sp. X23 TaxID=3045146 RepID=UPI0024AD2649|nr:hypothetical protein [Petroclostridium sp. X23]WHH59209.1 hypothetical protein QKW49_00105 [Petroclostridium sp. X23]